MLFGIVEVTFSFGLGGLLSKNVDVAVLDLEAYTFYTTTGEKLQLALPSPSFTTTEHHDERMVRSEVTCLDSL